MARIIINTAFAEAAEKWMSGKENPLYQYSCRECDAEYITEDRDLKYCNSEKCLDKDHVLSGPWLFED